MISKGLLRLNAFGRMALGTGLMVVALGGRAMAGSLPAPEIDAGSMGSALALLSCAVLVVTNRVKRK